MKRTILHRLDSVCEEGEKSFADLVEEKKLQRQASRHRSTCRVSVCEPDRQGTPAAGNNQLNTQAPRPAQEIKEEVQNGEVSSVYFLVL